MAIQYKTVSYGSEVKEIGVVSDTHIPARGKSIPGEFYERLKNVQLILHAGDLVEEKVLDELKALAPVEAVAGNMDPPPLHSRLGRLKLVRVGEIGIGMLHGDMGGRRINYDLFRELFQPETPQVVVFGPLHEPVREERNGTLYFNPGSLIDPRRTASPSCGLLHVNGRQVSGEIIYLK